METKTAVLVSFTEKVKNDGSGSYFYVQMNDSNGAALPQHMCFDKKITTYKTGAKIEFTSNEKDGKWFMNFPKEGGKPWAGGAGSYRPSNEAALKLQSLIQTHTMPMSYAKDLVVALVNAGVFAKAGDSVTEKIMVSMLKIYTDLRKEINSDPAVQTALGVKGGAGGGATHNNSFGADSRKKLAEDVTAYINGLTALGWVFPEGTVRQMLQRMSLLKREGSNTLYAGHPTVETMTDAEVKVAVERFKTFQQNECQGEPRDCKYYEKVKDGTEAHFCQWTTRCFYVDNKTGRHQG